MPIFEYKCSSCGHVTEIMERGTSSKQHTCAQCASPDVKKLLSGFAVGRSKTSSPRSCHHCPGGPCDELSCATGQCPYSS